MFIIICQMYERFGFIGFFMLFSFIVVLCVVIYIMYITVHDDIDISIFRDPWGIEERHEEILDALKKIEKKLSPPS